MRAIATTWDRVQVSRPCRVDLAVDFRTVGSGARYPFYLVPETDITRDVATAESPFSGLTGSRSLGTLAREMVLHSVSRLRGGFAGPRPASFRLLCRDGLRLEAKDAKLFRTAMGVDDAALKGDVLGVLPNQL